MSFTSSQGWSQADSRVPPKRNNIFIPEHSTSWWQLWDIFVFNLRYLWVHDPIRRAYFSDNGWKPPTSKFVNDFNTSRSRQTVGVAQISTNIFLGGGFKKTCWNVSPRNLGGFMIQLDLRNIFQMDGKYSPNQIDYFHLADTNFWATCYLKRPSQPTSGHVSQQELEPLAVNKEIVCIYYLYIYIYTFEIHLFTLKGHIQQTSQHGKNTSPNYWNVLPFFGNLGSEKEISRIFSVCCRFGGTFVEQWHGGRPWGYGCS